MLSVTSEYALRALVALVQSEPGQAVVSRELAKRADVPPHYLAKVLGTLKRAGLLKSSHGFQGGFQFELPPEKVRLIEVVEQFDGIRAYPDCFFGRSKPCSDKDPCTAHESWRDVRRAYIDFLEQTTLAELAGGMGKKQKKKAGKKRKTRRKKRTERLT